MTTPSIYKILANMPANRVPPAWKSYWQNQFGDFWSKTSTKGITTLELLTETIITFVAEYTGMRYTTIHLKNDDPLLLLIHIKYKQSDPGLWI